MATKAPVNPRKQVLDVIAKRIEKFLSLDTDGRDVKARELLYEAIDCIRKATVLIVKVDNDAKEAD